MHHLGVLHYHLLAQISGSLQNHNFPVTPPSAFRIPPFSLPSFSFHLRLFCYNDAVRFRECVLFRAFIAQQQLFRNLNKAANCLWGRGWRVWQAAAVGVPEFILIRCASPLRERNRVGVNHG